MPVKTVKFPKELMQAVLWEEAGTIISDRITDTSRWSIHHELIFKLEDATYRVHYSEGATESQDERPFEYDGPEIEVVEVSPVRKEVVVWEPVEA